MAYTAQWVNRIDRPNHVQISLNLLDGIHPPRRIQDFDFKKTPAQVDAAFLANVATTIINRVVAEELAIANMTAFVLANADLNIIAFNNTDIATLITRNSLPYTSAQVKNFVQDAVVAFNTSMLRNIAKVVYS